MQRLNILQENRQKAELFLEYGVQLGQDVQHKERKSEVSVDDGVAEREGDVLKGTKGVLRGGQAVADPLGSVVVRVEERFDHFGLVEQRPQCIAQEQPARFGEGRDHFLPQSGKHHSSEVSVFCQPVAESDPPDKEDHQVDVFDFPEVLSDEVEPVVEAPQARDVYSPLQVEVVVEVDEHDELIGHPMILAHHG